MDLAKVLANGDELISTGILTENVAMVLIKALPNRCIQNLLLSNIA